VTRNREVRWVESDRELSALIGRMERASIVALDTEQDAFFAYRPRVCLLQIAVAGIDHVVDTLALPDLSAMAEVLADPAIIKVFHAADNDIALLKRDHSLHVRGLFDTMAASSILGYKRTGLAALIEQHFGVMIEKKYQRSDWRKRPLEPGQIEYAALDVRFLDELREILFGELEKLGRLEEAASDFERIEKVAHEPRPFSADEYYNLQGARTLDGTQRRILRDLFVFRDRLAREENRAPYRICSDSVLFALAKQPPKATHELGRYSGLGDRLLQRHARTLVDVVLAALDAGELAPPPPPPRESTPLDDSERALFDALRDWRKKRAEQRGVDAGRVIPNSLLLSVVRRRASTESELAAAGLEPWRIREYGEDILHVIAKKGRPAR
jgi:ribonuclease D